jgi:hypothetical protein
MAKSMSSDSRNPGAGVQSGLASKDPVKDPAGQLSKPLDKETAKQGPHTPVSLGGSFKLK